MNEKIEELLNALIRVCVFVHTSRNWEDYENMALDTESLNSMKHWFIESQGYDDGSISKSITEISRYQYTSLKTDWTIGSALVTNTVAMLDHNQKTTVRSYIESLLPAALKNDAGVTKAIDAIMKEM